MSQTLGPLLTRRREIVLQSYPVQGSKTITVRVTLLQCWAVGT